MNRSKKLVRNLIIIVSFLMVFYYFGGYYFSKEQCVTETLRGLYGTETKEIMELCHGNYIATVMADENDESFSIVGTNKTGFLYRTADCYTGIRIDKEKCMTISGKGTSEYFLVFIYRNDKSIAKVEIALENGETYTITEWQKDFAGYVRTNADWSYGTYRAYNAEGELVGEEFYY